MEKRKYPAKRKSYSTERSGVGGRPKKGLKGVQKIQSFFKPISGTCTTGDVKIPSAYPVQQEATEHYELGKGVQMDLGEVSTNTETDSSGYPHLRNSCLIPADIRLKEGLPKEYFSCAVDSMIEIAHGLLLDGVQHSDGYTKALEKSEVVASLMNASQKRINSIQHEVRDEYWDLLVEIMPSAMCPKGTSKAEVRPQVECLTKTSIGRIDISFNQECSTSSFPVTKEVGINTPIFLSHVKGTESVDLQQSVKQRVELLASHIAAQINCSCGSATCKSMDFQIVNLPDIAIFELGVHEDHKRCVAYNSTDVTLSTQLCLDGKVYHLKAVLLHSYGHFMSIVKIKGNWYVCDNMDTNPAQPNGSIEKALRTVGVKSTKDAPDRFTILADQGEIGVSYVFYQSCDTVIKRNDPVLKVADLDQLGDEYLKTADFIHEDPQLTEDDLESWGRAKPTCTDLPGTKLSTVKQDEANTKMTDQKMETDEGHNEKGITGETTPKMEIKTDHQHPEEMSELSEDQPPFTSSGTYDGRSRGQSETLRFWSHQYSWLTCESTTGDWMCKDCEMFGVSSRGLHSNSWISKGVKSLGRSPNDTLQKHEKSKKHTDAVGTKVNARVYFGIEKTQEYSKSLKKKKQENNTKALQKLFQIIIFIITKKIPQTSTYRDLVSFIGETLHEEVLGQFLKMSPGNAKYTSVHSLYGMIEIINKWMKEKTLTFFRSRSMFTLLLDESPDAANREEMLIYLRAVDDNGQIVVEFADLVRVTDRTAEGLKTILVNWVAENGLEMRKCFFASMDTTNTMSGIRGGLQKLLRDIHGHLIYVKCRNHLLALPFVHLKAHHDIIRRFLGLMFDLWNTFDNSSKRQDILENTFKAKGKPMRRMIKAVPTRWLTISPQNLRHTQFFEEQLDAYDAIYESKNEPSIKGIRDEMCRPDMIACTSFLADVLPTVNVVAASLQEHILIFSKIPEMRQRILDLLDEKIENPCLEKPENCSCVLDDHSRAQKETPAVAGCAMSNCSARLAIAQDRSVHARQTRGRQHAETFDLKQHFETQLKPVAQDLRTEIADALDFEPELRGLCVLDPMNFPSSETDLDDYGEEEFKLAVEHYGMAKRSGKDVSFPKINKTETYLEFKAAKVTIYDMRENFKEEKTHQIDKITKDLEAAKQTLSRQDLPKKRKAKLQKQVKSLTANLADARREEFHLDRLLKVWHSSNYPRTFPNMTLLLKAAGLVASSTAVVECGWSTMNLFQTNLRATTTQQHLNWLMRIALFKRAIDLEEITRRWLKSPRRIDVSTDMINSDLEDTSGDDDP